jgi:hypothetical protein
LDHAQQNNMDDMYHGYVGSHVGVYLDAKLLFKIKNLPEVGLRHYLGNRYGYYILKVHDGHLEKREIVYKIAENFDASSHQFNYLADGDRWTLEKITAMKIEGNYPYGLHNFSGTALILHLANKS